MGTVMRILDVEQNSDAEDVPRRRDAGAAGVVKRHQDTASSISHRPSLGWELGLTMQKKPLRNNI